MLQAAMFSEGASHTRLTFRRLRQAQRPVVAPAPFTLCTDQIALHRVYCDNSDSQCDDEYDDLYQCENEVDDSCW